MCSGSFASGCGRTSSIPTPGRWRSFAIPKTPPNACGAVAGDKYSYRELDDYTDLIVRTLKTLPIVSKVTRSGLLQEQVYLEYSQERLASYGVTPSTLKQVLGARNITLPGGMVEVGDKNLTVDPSGEFKSEREIGDVLLRTSNGKPVYLRDLVTVGRGYESPARYLNFYSAPSADGSWRRARAVTLAVQMRAGGKIGEFAAAVDGQLEQLRGQMPTDLVLARTSDQPRQVDENIGLFMGSLYEAVALVVLVSLIGFWEWRSALLMALSIPITLAMTLGMMQVLGIDLQQMSIASLIIALGLLVDDPVVAGDAIKRDLAAGDPPIVAAWWGPTKLAKAIMFATITNIVAYVPFLFLPGDPGTFLYSLPVVIGCSLVASRLVSMTFIPLLGYYLLRAKPERSIEERRKSGFAALYYRVGGAAIRHRWAVLAASTLLLAAGGSFMSRLKTQFFPVDLQYLSYVDVWLPEDAPVVASNRVASQVETTLRRVADEYGQRHADDPNHPRPVLKSLTTFVGGGGPRFWFSVAPEQKQPNYAQVLVEVFDKHDTRHLVSEMQSALSAEIPGARLDVRQLETGPPVGIPVSIRLSGENIATLRHLAGQVADIFRSVPTATRIRDNWGPESFAVRLRTDADKANLSGLTNYDVAAASASAMSGATVAVLREGDDQIPVVARLRVNERSQLSDIQSLYVYASQGAQKVPLQSISSIVYEMQTEKLQRRNQFRTITVSAFPDTGVLPSEVLSAALGQDRRAAAHPARRLSPRDRRRVRGAGEELQEPGGRDAHLDCAHLPGARLPVQARHQAAHRLCGDSVRRGRRAGGALADGQPVRVHGVPRHRQPDWRHRQPHHRAVRLHRGAARGRRAARRGAARCRHHPLAAGPHHRRGHGDSALPARGSWRPAVGAAVLRPDWRPLVRHLRHAAAGAGDLRHVRARSEAGAMGCARTAAAGRGAG